jgi:hypothetical protein
MEDIQNILPNAWMPSQPNILSSAWGEIKAKFPPPHIEEIQIKGKIK